MLLTNGFLNIVIILLLIFVVVSLYCAELVLKKRSFFSSSSRTSTARSVLALDVQLQLVVVPGIVQYVMYYKYLAVEALVVAVVCEGPIIYQICFRMTKKT